MFLHKGKRLLRYKSSNRHFRERKQRDLIQLMMILIMFLFKSKKLEGRIPEIKKNNLFKNKKQEKMTPIINLYKRRKLNKNKGTKMSTKTTLNKHHTMKKMKLK